jgi:hypothetical protein
VLFTLIRDRLCGTNCGAEFQWIPWPLRSNVVEAGVLVASWDDPEGGGITTQTDNLTELAEAIKESVRCHFAGRSVPREVSLHFESDPVLQLA